MKSEPVDLTLTNGRIVTPEGIYSGCIAVKEGRIAAICDREFLPPARNTIDLKGRHILPGIVDSEAHPGCYVPFERDVTTESRAAAAAGVTTWGIQGPSTRLGQEPFKEFIQAEDVVSFKEPFGDAVRIVQTRSMVDAFFTYMLETDQHALEIPDYAKEQGVTSFKLYLHCKKVEQDKYWGARRAGLGYGMDDGTIYLAMEQTARLGPPGIVSIHAENWEVARIFESRLIKAGRTDFGAWSDRSPHFLEAHHIRSYAYIAKVTGCPLYIQHATTPESYEEIRRARGEGLKVYAQTGPAWLYFNKDNGWRINVPLRDAATVEKIWEALAEGVIDCIGSDHVIAWDPCSREELYNPNIWKLRTGFTSRVELFLPVLLSEGVNKGRIPLERVVEVACRNPARIYGLYPKKGAICVGADADFVVIDLDREVIVNKEMVVSRSGWSLLEGHKMKGWPIMTILRGEVTAEWPDGAPGPRVVGEPRGRYLKRIPGRSLYPLEASA